MNDLEWSEWKRKWVPCGHTVAEDMAILANAHADLFGLSEPAEALAELVDAIDTARQNYGHMDAPAQYLLDALDNARRLLPEPDPSDDIPTSRDAG